MNKRKRAAMERLESRMLMHGDVTSGTGLLAQYFDNKDFTNLKLTRTDATVNFAWAYGSPDPSIAPDTFSARWTGQIVPDYTESYTFSTSTDDGVRLWVNNKLVIDKLVNQPLTTATSTKIPLVAGQAYDIRMDYFDNTGQATAKLMWASPSTPKAIIPMEHLFPGTPPPPPPPPAPSTIRIDAAGSTAYTDENGKVWSADKYYSGGNLSLGLFDIANTTDDVMYATRRFGTSFSYAIPVVNGDYKLNLLFADASFNAGGRLFNVTAESTQILKNFDIVAAAGGKAIPITESFSLTVNDGTLNLSFKSVLNNATLSAIEIVPANVTAPTINWKTVAASPVLRAESLGGMVNGKLYTLGGLANDNTGGIIALSNCEVYDPTTDTWTQLADEPEAITHAGIVIDGSTIWLLGGYVGNHPGPGTAHVWKYDTTTDTWSSGPDLPAARGAGAAVLLGRQIHFFGGMDETRTIDEGDHWALDLDALALDPTTTWTTAAPLANPRNHIAGAVVNGKIYAIGGQHAQEFSQDPQREVDMYDPATDTWTRVADLPDPRSHINASTFVMDNKIIVLGGENGYNLPQSTIYAYDPILNTWSLIGMLPANRSTSVAGVLGPGQIISATGNTPNPSATTWIGTFITNT